VRNVTRYLGQALAYLLFIIFIGYFSTSPSYTFTKPDQAVIKLTFIHAGKRKEPCRKRTGKELAEMPAHLRKKMDCPRERSPLFVQIDLDGKTIFSREIQPKGLSHDLPSPVYQRFTIPAGTHHLHARMRDDIHTKGFNYERSETIKLAPSQILVIDFDSERKEFIFN
jgi:hypothetical protein